MAFRSRRRAEISEAVAEGTVRLERLLQGQLDTLAQAQAIVIESVATTRREMERRESDLVQVLGLVSDLCRHAIDVIEADRIEHHRFLASLAEAVTPDITAPPSAPAVGSPTEKVLGGTVFASPVDVDLNEIEADERSDYLPGVDTSEARLPG
jgi:hypothetical protein